MKVYRVDFQDAGEGCLVSWHASRREAEKYLHAQQRERGEAQGPETVRAVEIPTTRADLIGWLNRNLTTDNG